jgi:hypothetical protein
MPRREFWRLRCVLLNMAFAARYLTESRNPADHVATDEPRKSSRQAIWRVMSRSSEPSSRLIWILCNCDWSFPGELLRTRVVFECTVSGNRANNRLLLHVRRLHFSLHSCVVVGTNG